MKKILFTISLFFAVLSANATVKIDKIDPPFWYTGMQNPSLQLMVYGEDIGAANVQTTYPGITIDSLIRVDSPNYLLVYLNIASTTKPGNVPLIFKLKHRKKVISYELRKRTMNGKDRIGFDSSDVFYMLMPDRFANGNPKNDVIKGMRSEICNRNAKSLRHGGDIAGLQQHLNYFDELGITALWLTPVLENDMTDNNGYSCYHGYATTDYYRVDRRLGTNEEYRDFITKANKKGIKVVMDMIFNHCGSDHIWLKDTPMKNWFNHPDHKNNYVQTSYKLTPAVDPYASKIDTDEMENGWFVPTMPDLNQLNPHVMRYLVQNSFWWIEFSGIDGIRMDTYPYANAGKMAEWLKELNEEYPNYNVVAETWVTVPAYTATWQKDSKLANYNTNLKTVMDFAFNEAINRAKSEETDGWWNGLNRIYNTFVYDYLYPNPLSVMAFLENHDTDRFLGDGQDIKALQQAVTLLLTSPRIPQLYYGSEIMMNGTKAVTDGDVRKDFPGGWAEDKANAFTKEGRTELQNKMFNFMKNILHWRKGNEVISKGKMVHFMPYKGVYVYYREYKGKTVVVLLNGTSKDVSIPKKRYAEVLKTETQGVNIITHRKIDLSKEDIKLSPRQSMVIEF